MPRRPVPATLQVLNGNPNRKTKAELNARIEKEQSMKIKAEKLTPPTWLNKDAKKEFKRIAELLKDVELMTEADIGMLAAYCDAYTTYIECSKVIEEDGLMSNGKPHPLLTKKKNAFEQMRSVAGDFGLTPSGRLKLAIPKEKPKEENEFNRMFGDV